MKRKQGMTKFGKSVKKKLIDMNMTQVELADMLGIKKQYLNKILCGERSGKSYLPAITRILDIDIAA